MFKRLIVGAALACTVVSGANAQPKYYRDGAPLSCVLIYASQSSVAAIVIRGDSFVLYGIYSGETRGTVEVTPPFNGKRTLVVKYESGGAETATMDVKTGAVSMNVVAAGITFDFYGRCN